MKTLLSRASRNTFGIPILLAAITAAGLLSALLGDDMWDALSWAALGLPVAVCLWFWLGQRPS